MLLSAISDYFYRGNPFTRRALVRPHRKRLSDPSFSELLPWLDVDKRGRVLLDNGKSVGVAMELYPRAAEAKADAVLDELHHALERLLAEGFHEMDEDPWIMQVYTFYDQKALLGDWQRAVDECVPQAERFKGNDSMCAVFHEHVLRMTRESQVFCDELGNGHPWRVGRQRVICCVYRHHARASVRHPMKELDAQLERLCQQLNTCSIRYRFLNDAELSTWLSRWFDPDVDEQCSENLAAQRRGFDYSLSDVVCPRAAHSDADSGIWSFGEHLCRVCCVQRLRQQPNIGQLSLSCIGSNGDYSLIEQLPPGAVIVMTLAFTSSQWVEAHLDRIEHSSVGSGAGANASREAASAARHRLMSGAKLYPSSMAIYLSASSADHMERQYESVDALFLANHLQLLPYKEDPIALDSYLRHLPMAYRYSMEQIRYRNQLVYARDIAALLPLYGRAVGSGRVGLTFFNRGGGLLTHNVLDMRDRRKNAHLFLFGPTGAGKSATLCYLQMLLMSFHRPRLVVIEAGNSYGLLAQYFASQGLKVKDVVLRPGCGARLGPFAGLSDSLRGHLAQNDGVMASRDWLGEMALLTRLMITGGKRKEEARMSRADEAVQLQAIKTAVESNTGPLRVSHICAALLAMANNCEDERKARLREMSDALSLFTVGFAGELFDGDGEDWQAADYVRLDLGLLTGSDYQDLLAVAWLSLVNSVVNFAERTQQDGRQIILLTDEAHVITSNPLLADYVVKISKLLGRRLGLWLWMATQNISDFDGESQKMLEMFEWWLALGLGSSEVEALSHYKSLNRNALRMLASTRKLPGRYTEGVILGDNYHERFRHVPPPLCLALAQTEKEEKTYRRKLMRRFSCSELEAAKRVAEELSQARDKG